MKGKRLPRKRRPDYERGEVVRFNRGRYVGQLGIVMGTKKDRVVVETDNFWRHLTVFTKPISIDRIDSTNYQTFRRIGQVNFLRARLGEDWWQKW